MTAHENTLARIRFWRRAEHVCAMGSRAVGEILLEVAKRHDCRDSVDELLAEYSTLPVNTLQLLGVDRYPAPPLHDIKEAA